MTYLPSPCLISDDTHSTTTETQSETHPDLEGETHDGQDVDIQMQNFVERMNRCKETSTTITTPSACVLVQRLHNELQRLLAKVQQERLRHTRVLSDDLVFEIQNFEASLVETEAQI